MRCSVQPNSRGATQYPQPRVERSETLGKVPNMFSKPCKGVVKIGGANIALSGLIILYRIS